MKAIVRIRPNIRTLSPVRYPGQREKG